MKLYEMTAEWESIIQTIQDAEGEVAPELLARIEAIGGAFDEKADACAAAVRTLEATEEAAKKEQDRLAAYRKTLTSHADWLRAYLLDQMVRFGRVRIEGPRFRLSVANCPPSVDVQDEAAVPRTWFITQPAKLDKAGVLVALKGGQAVAGCALVTDRTTLRIK